MTKASSFSAGRPAQGVGSPFAANTHDPFKEKAERLAARREGKAVQLKAVGAAPVLPTATAIDHFARKSRSSARPVAVSRMGVGDPQQAVATPEAETRGETVKAQGRVLSNGATLSVAPSQQSAAVSQVRTDAVVRAQKPAVRPSSLVLVSGAASGAAFAMIADTPEPAPAPPAVEPAPLAPLFSDTPEVKPDKLRGGGSGGGPGGGGDGTPPSEKRFDQDDLVGVVLVIAMLLILLLMFFQNRAGKPTPDDRIVAPQFAAVTPPRPLSDPYGSAPGDLTPKSPIPDAAPAPVLDAPQLAEPTPSAPELTTSTPALVQSACAPGRMVQAYFCTAKSSLTPAARDALNREVTAWKACAAGRELVVTGFADTRGENAYNAWLGGLRATTVSNFLRDAGLTVSETNGVGELPDLDDGQNCPNQRRVDVTLKDGSPLPPNRSCLPPEDEAPIICP